MNKQKKSSVVKASDHPDKRRDRLAEAFPLLFGKTAEDRSTLGKYTSNKDKLLTKRAPVDFSDENSAPSNAQNNVDFSRTTPLKQPTSAKKAARRSSFLSMSSLKHKSSTQQSKLSKTICITSPQPRGLELIEDKKFSNASLNSTQVTDYNLQSEQGDRNSTVVNLVAALSPEKPLENKIAPSSATNIASPTIVRSNEHEIFQQQSDIKPAVDDTAVIVALRNFISTMESNDTEQTKNESNFQTIDAATSIPTTEEAITTNVEPTVNEYITLESEIKIAGDEKGMVILPDLHIDSRRTSSSSYVSSAYNSQRSSLCTEHVPVTDEYVSNALGDKDIVPARNSNSTAEKILVHPRFAMMNEAMIHGLVVVEVYDRIQFENHTKFILNVQVLSIPTISESFGSIRMVLMKRLSEFKALRQNLLGILKPHAEGIPPLPTRQVLSMGGDYSDRDFLDSRQRYLRNWVNSIMVRQSVEGPEFRKILINFLSS